MRVPPSDFYMDDYLAKALDHYVVERITQKNPKHDSVLILDGAEGQGKTSMSVGIGYYVAWKSGRQFDHRNIFFDVNKMLDFLKKTENQIVIWDEPAMQALSKDALTRTVKDLSRFLIMARKKRHFIMINVAYFNLFIPYLVWERPQAMIHIYTPQKLKQPRFVFIEKKNLEGLYNEWLRTRRRTYRKYCNKIVRGSFSDILNPEHINNVLDHFDLDYYEQQKDDAIQMIGEEDVSKKTEKLYILQYLISTIKDDVERQSFLERFNISESTLNTWKTRYGRFYKKFKDSLKENGE